jgi:hypothetical protein
MPRHAVVLPPAERPGPGPVAAGAGWVPCSDLARPEWVARAVSRLRASQGGGRDVAAGHLLSWYAANVVGPAIAAFVVARRVPDLDPAQMSVRRAAPAWDGSGPTGSVATAPAAAAPTGTPGPVSTADSDPAPDDTHLDPDHWADLDRADAHWFDVTAFHSPRLLVLPDDPLAAGLPADAPPATAGAAPDQPADGAAGAGAGATAGVGAGAGAGARIEVVADVDELRSRLVGALVAQLTPVLAAMRGTARLGYPALWGAVTAQCARTFLLTERVTGDPQLGRIEADAFFALACPPMRSRPTWARFTHQGREHTGMRRGSCCLAYRLSSEYCTSCPFTADPEREHRLRAWVDAQGPGGLAV